MVIAASIAAVLVCLLVPVLGCVLVTVMIVLVMRWRWKRQTTILMVPGEYKYAKHQDGITNAVYAYARKSPIEKMTHWHFITLYNYNYRDTVLLPIKVLYPV